jgi:L-fucose isomerase
MTKNRLIGDYPVIGIRPVIDARRGPLKVRESLEEQTMNMAKAAKKLFEQNLRYSNGDPVKVIIADTTIGRVAEAAACADKFKKAGVDITLTVTPCWCYGSETIDMDPMTIKGIWGFNGTERPGAVYLAAALAAHAQKGLPAFGIYGHEVQDKDQSDSIPTDVEEKLLRFGRAAIAAATMRGKSYLQIGSVSMGIAGSIIDNSFFEKYLVMLLKKHDTAVHFVGDAVPLYKDYIKEQGINAYFAPDELFTHRAAAVARIAWLNKCEGVVSDAFSVLPNYLRKSQAERMKDKK